MRYLKAYSVPLKIKSYLIWALVTTWTTIWSRSGQPARILSIYTCISFSLIFVYVLRLCEKMANLQKLWELLPSDKQTNQWGSTLTSCRFLALHNYIF